MKAAYGLGSILHLRAEPVQFYAEPERNICKLDYASRDGQRVSHDAKSRERGDRFHVFYSMIERFRRILQCLAKKNLKKIKTPLGLQS